MSDTADLQSSLALFSLKDNAQFLVANAVGDCAGGSQGLFRDDTRVLSRFALLLGGHAPSLLSSALSQDNVYFRAHLTNRPLPQLGEVFRPGPLARRNWAGRSRRRASSTSSGRGSCGRCGCTSGSR